MSKPVDQILSTKDMYYEQTTRIVRWLAIGIVASTYPPTGSHWIIVTWLILAATAYNLLRYFPWLLKYRFFASKINMLVTDNLFVAALVILSGGLSSHYVSFFVFMIMTSAFWYGSRGVVGVIAAQIGVIATLDRFILTTPVPTDPFRLTLLRISTLVALGYLAERLTHAERSERHQAEQFYAEVENQHQKLLALINSITEGVIAIENDGKITLYNAAALEVLNKNGDLLNTSIKDTLPLTTTNGQQIDWFSRAADSSKIYHSTDYIYTSPDQSKVNIDLCVAPIFLNAWPKPENHGFIVVLRDITKEKSLEDQRNEFISVTSHELRTPLAIAEANISTALMPGFARIDPKATELLELAHEKVIFLGELLRDLTTMSRAEQGALAIKLELLNPQTILGQLAQDYRSEAETRHDTLTIDIEPDLPPVLTSRFRVQEILQNFISNSLKYTHDGKIILRAKKSPDVKGGVIFSVEDTGIGISNSDQKHLFEKFYRSEDYRTRETGGTGLGLYITRKLAERLNAKIWFKSKLDHGSTFYVQIPPYSELPEDRRQVVEAEINNLVETI